MNNKTDEELIENVKQDCMDSFKALYDKYRTPIYNYLYHLIRNAAIAEDCTHDVFIHLYKKAALYKPTAKFSSWLYRMARNMALDTLRKRRGDKYVSLDSQVNIAGEASAPLSDFLSDPDVDLEKAVISREIIRSVEEGVSKLNEVDRQIILLCDMQELPHKEVGEILGCATQTVTVKLHRARRRLAAILKIKGFEGQNHD